LSDYLFHPFGSPLVCFDIESLSISGLEKATMKEKTGLNKSDYHLNIESRDSEVQMIEDGRKPPLPLSVMDSKGLCCYFDIVICNLFSLWHS
jgi:hypothetical protein